MPVIFFISDFENIREPNNAKGKLDKLYKNMLLISALLKSPDVKTNKPGSSIAHSNVSRFVMKNTKTSKA